MNMLVSMIKKYVADEGKVFDWATPRYEPNGSGEEVQKHLYVKQLFMGENDSIDNYVEVDEPKEE